MCVSSEWCHLEQSKCVKPFRCRDVGLDDCICRAEEWVAHRQRGRTDPRACAICADSMYACKEEPVQGDTSSTEIHLRCIRMAVRLLASVGKVCEVLVPSGIAGSVKRGRRNTNTNRPAVRWLQVA